MDELKLYKLTLFNSIGFYFNMKISPSDREKKFINETTELVLKLRKSIKLKNSHAPLKTEEKFKNFINLGDWIIDDKEINIKDLLRSKNISFDEIENVNDEVYKYCIKYDKEGFFSYFNFVTILSLTDISHNNTLTFFFAIIPPLLRLE